VRADPEPDEIGADFDRQGTVVQADPGGPESADLL
jgi:hypothetical protein